jgi:hypothetical protein
MYNVHHTYTRICTYNELYALYRSNCMLHISHKSHRMCVYSAYYRHIQRYKHLYGKASSHPIVVYYMSHVFLWYTHFLLFCWLSPCKPGAKGNVNGYVVALTEYTKSLILPTDWIFFFFLLLCVMHCIYIFWKRPGLRFHTRQEISHRI